MTSHLLRLPHRETVFVKGRLKLTEGACLCGPGKVILARKLDMDAIGAADDPADDNAALGAADDTAIDAADDAQDKIGEEAKVSWTAVSV